MESAYLSSELTILHGWDIVRRYEGKKGKTTQAVEAAFSSIYTAYQQICSAFLATNILPHVEKRHAISSAVRSSCSIDVNLKLFDLLGRLGTDGIWAYWGYGRCPEEEVEAKQQMLQEASMYMTAIKELVSNNPALLLPLKDDQSIDIFIAVSFLAFDANNNDIIKNWLEEILDRADFTFRVNGPYPCILSNYSELLLHPKSGDDKYRENVTSGSILYPTIALWAALFDYASIYSKVATLKAEKLRHCNFQFWYPDECSEENFYTNKAAHGAALSDVCVDRPKEELLAQVFGECDQSPHFKELSAIKFGWWPLIVVACRHYRLPLPLHLLKGFRNR
jgi:hypothetical protein